METTILLVSIAGETAAIDTACVKQVVELGRVTAIPCLPDHVEGLATLRSRAMTVIDCRRSLCLDAAPSPPDADAPRLAVVIEQDGFLYALLIDSFADVVTVDALPGVMRMKPQAGWERVSRGMVSTPQGPVQLLDPAQVIAGMPQPCAA